MIDLTKVRDNLIVGKAGEVRNMVKKAVDEGVGVEKILDEALIAGMDVVGKKFQANEFYVPRDAHCCKSYETRNADFKTPFN